MVLIKLWRYWNVANCFSHLCSLFKQSYAQGLRYENNSHNVLVMGTLLHNFVEAVDSNRSFFRINLNKNTHNEPNCKAASGVFKIL